ncbi:hypothetical protein UA08_06240 [Talaromyces atroroseus]|uniref:DUF7732 domain-containing protein n=1 Tax=Talaromyces atroroseus TaxID=1441469 RepID=A0A225ACD7_TALAT|nr:hypothetical protein UA08_06240 [Talaromyces atroroseus]OKL58752.1 hypothetical protein UA08_06240 [Talaromyces atroroseus]
MKTSSITSILLLFSPLVSSLAVPQGDLVVLNDPPPEAIPDVSELEKRRGGGGGGGRGGSSSGGSKGSGSSSSSGSSKGSGRSSSSSSGSSKSNSGSSGSGSSSGSSGSKGSSGSSSSGSKSSSSNVGGTTRSGSGTPRTYGGGGYYAGGATTPFAAGSRTLSGILPFALLGGALGIAAGSAWHGYGYPFYTPYYYHDPMAASHNNGQAGNYTMNVVCYCEQYSECGCDDNKNSTYLAEVIGDPPHNSSIVTIVQNGTNETAYINGTLANGTTAADPNASGASAMLAVGSAWPVVALVSAMIYYL